MTKLDQFMALMHDQVGRGIYVWGADGEDLTAMKDPEAWIERHAATVENGKLALNLFRKMKDKGINPIRAFDCSGLIYWGLHTLKLQKSDISSRGIYGLCTKIEKKDLRVGDFVFHHDGKKIVHVGVYAGQNLYIEDRGSKYGVVLNKTHYAGYWNRFGRWKAFENQEIDPDKPKTRVYVKAKSVNIRSVDHVPTNKKEKAETVIGIAHKGETYRLLEIAPTGWYKIEYNGSEGYISNKPTLTELV